MTNSIELVYFSTGLPKTIKYGENRELQTAICKESTEEAYLSKNGFKGDDVADKKNHGGPDRAVCVYPYEHYQLWESEFDQKLPPGAFGENLTVTNMREDQVCVGDVFQVGEAIIQITQGRIPCDTINKRTNNPHLLKRFIDTGYTGYLCRVLKEGVVRHDSKISLLERHPNEVTVLYGNELYFDRPDDVEGMKRLLEVKELATKWQEKLHKRINNLKNKQA